MSDIETLVLHEPVSYARGLELQRERWAGVAEGSASDGVFLLEHTPVITLGRETKPEHVLHPREALAAMGVELFDADRGGDATYHGPGQLVAYPILKLTRYGLGIRGYIRRMEQVLIDLLDTYGIQGERVEGLTGVWVDGEKVAACGIGVRKWVTMHGIALNVDPNMDHFRLIVPCGIADRPVTSMKLLLGYAPKMEQVRDRFLKVFMQSFVAKEP